MDETAAPRSFKIDGSDVLFVEAHQVLFSRDEDDVLRVHASLILEACGIEDSQVQKQAHLMLPPQTAWTLAHSLIAAVTEMPAFDSDRQPWGTP
jgi:hypothetical protein